VPRDAPDGLPDEAVGLGLRIHFSHSCSLHLDEPHPEKLAQPAAQRVPGDAAAFLGEDGAEPLLGAGAVEIQDLEYVEVEG